MLPTKDIMFSLISSSDEEEKDARSFSNDEKEPMNPNLYKQVKKMNNCLKKSIQWGIWSSSKMGLTINI